MIEYLLKSACSLTILLAFYHLVLEREKMHQFNRFYLLGSVLFSFVAPLFIITIQVPTETIDIPLTYSEPIVFDNQNIMIEKPIDYWKIAFGFSIFISLILSIRFGINLYKIFKKVTVNTKIQLENAVLVLVKDTISPHTFWNYIFINKEEYYSQKIENELFTHELTHVTQKHTFDVLLIEVLKIVFWFNPLFYFLKRQIQLNHEFIADENVINSCNNISKYQYLLLNRAAWNNDYYLASNLNYSLTKKRLVMMTTKTSKVNNRLKKLAVIPLLTGSIYVFAERVEIYEEVNNKEFLDAEINKGNIKPENQKINNDFFKNKSNNSSEIKSSTMPLELLEDINKKLKDVNSLKMSIKEKKDTFNVNLPNGEKIKVWEVKDSIPTTGRFINRKKGTFSYTTMDGKTITKKISELTDEEKKLIPPPPAKTKTGFITADKQTLYYVKNEKGTTYYNRWGQQVTKEGKIINPEQTASDKVIPNQNITKVYKDNNVVSEFRQTQLPPPPPPKPNFPQIKKGDVTNIPPPPLPETRIGRAQNAPIPPKPMAPIEYIKKHKDNSSIYYYNNNKISYKKALKLLENKSLNLQSWNQNGKTTFKITDDPISIKTK